MILATPLIHWAAKLSPSTMNYQMTLALIYIHFKQKIQVIDSNNPTVYFLKVHNNLSSFQSLKLLGPGHYTPTLFSSIKDHLLDTYHQLTFHFCLILSRNILSTVHRIRHVFNCSWGKMSFTDKSVFLTWDTKFSNQWGKMRSKKTRSTEHHMILCNPIFRSDDMEMRRGREWCHKALKTRFWCAFTDWEGLWALYLMSKMWITGSAEPDVMYNPSGDHAWFIRADCDSLLSCFQPNSWITVCLNLISNSRSCLSGVLQKINCCQNCNANKNCRKHKETCYLHWNKKSWC